MEDERDYRMTEEDLGVLVCAVTCVRMVLKLSIVSHTNISL